MRTKRSRKIDQVGNRLSNNREKTNTIEGAEHQYMPLRPSNMGRVIKMEKQPTYKNSMLSTEGWRWTRQDRRRGTGTNLAKPLSPADKQGGLPITATVR